MAEEEREKAKLSKAGELQCHARGTLPCHLVGRWSWQVDRLAPGCQTMPQVCGKETRARDMVRKLDMPLSPRTWDT